jgi:hypothetical protein
MNNGIGEKTMDEYGKNPMAAGYTKYNEFAGASERFNR